MTGNKVLFETLTQVKSIFIQNPRAMFQKFAQYEKASGVFIKNKNSPVSCHVDPVSADLLQGLEICIYKIPKYPRAKVLRQFAIFLQCSGV